MAKVRLEANGYCALTGKLKFKSPVEAGVAIQEILAKQARRMYTYLCEVGCLQWHLTHLDPSTYVWTESPVPKPSPVRRVGTTFPLPAATVKGLVEFKKRLGA